MKRPWSKPAIIAHDANAKRESNWARVTLTLAYLLLAIVVGVWLVRLFGA